MRHVYECTTTCVFVIVCVQESHGNVKPWCIYFLLSFLFTPNFGGLIVLSLCLINFLLLSQLDGTNHYYHLLLLRPLFDLWALCIGKQVSCPLLKKLSYASPWTTIVPIFLVTRQAAAQTNDFWVGGNYPNGWRTISISLLDIVNLPAVIFDPCTAFSISITKVVSGNRIQHWIFNWHMILIVNIWSHLLGFLLFIGLGIHFLWTQPFADSLTTYDYLYFFCFIAGAMTCLGFSSSFHCFQNHSEPVAAKWNRCDYAGIVTLTV